MFIFVCFRVRNKVIMKNKYGVIIEIEIMLCLVLNYCKWYN